MINLCLCGGERYHTVNFRPSFDNAMRNNTYFMQTFCFLVLINLIESVLAGLRKVEKTLIQTLALPCRTRVDEKWRRSTYLITVRVAGAG